MPVEKVALLVENHLLVSSVVRFKTLSVAQEAFVLTAYL